MGFKDMSPAKLHYHFRERLPMWVIYRPVTREYPGKWVARMHLTLPTPRHTGFVILHDSIEALRDALPPGLACLERSPDDAPQIAEVWL